MEVSWVRSIGVGCPTCGSVDIEFEYRHLYMMGDPKPVAREGTCTCKKCGHRFPHTQWRDEPSKVNEQPTPIEERASKRDRLIKQTVEVAKAVDSPGDHEDLNRQQIDILAHAVLVLFDEPTRQEMRKRGKDPDSFTIERDLRQRSPTDEEYAEKYEKEDEKGDD